MHEKFGGKVWRVPVDAGFTCPNRDGTLATGGCLYCNEAGSRAAFVDPKLPVREQILRGMETVANRTGAKKFLVYFQSYTNTYAPATTLERIYREALSFPEVVGISVGTRPDCLDPETVGLLAGLAHERYVLVELGVQTVNDETLARVNRGHDAQTSRKAFETLKRAGGIETLAHLMFGLPGDTAGDWKRSVRECVAWGADAFKFHHLYIEKGTASERLWRDGVWTVPGRDEYLEFLADILPEVPERIVFHRLFGQCARETLLAPDWTADKLANIAALDRLLESRDVRQGSNA